jgi:hypothetical protein
MTPLRGLVLAALVAALVGLQALALDRMPEKRAEDVYTKVGSIPASEMLPTYLASLFFGSFRALAIDVLWIQLRKLEEERRWDQLSETLTLISHFQPRNPEVWVHLAWHSAYNIANSFKDPAKSWVWFKRGLQHLRRGIDKIPDSAHLKYDLGYTLWHKPSWRTGKLDAGLLERVEADRELQEILQGRKDVERAMSMYELAILWLGRARDRVLELPEQKLVTQVGLVIWPSSCDTFVRECLFQQAMLEKSRGRYAAAKARSLEAADHTERMITKYREAGLSSLHQDWVRFLRALPAVLDLEERAARTGRPEDERALVAELQRVLIEVCPPETILDNSFYWDPVDRSALLSRLKKKLAAAQGTTDEQECNDDFKMASGIKPGELYQANLEPQGLDTDFYAMNFSHPLGPAAPPGARPDPPIPVRLRFSRPDASRIDLDVRLFDPLRKEIGRAEVRGRAQIRFEVRAFGPHYVRVAPLGNPSPWPEDTRYSLQAEIAP